MRSVSFHVVVALLAVGVPPAVGQSSPRPLQVGTPIEESISGTDVHVYTFSADANSTVAVVVMQKGVDVVVSLIAPDGQKVIDVDSPNGTDGPEPLSALVEAAGSYRVEIRRLLEQPNSPSGRYEVRLEALRRATEAELRTHSELKTLTKLEEQWESALEKHDLAAVSALMADDFFYFHNTPGGAAKTEQLAALAEQYKRNADVVESHTVTDRTIKVFGDTAVAGGGALIKMQRKDGTGVIPGRFMHVWQKRAGAWRIVADHFYGEGAEPRPRTEIKVAPAELEKLAGTYELVDGTHFKVSVESGGLVTRQTRPAEQWSIPFVAESPTEFFSGNGDFEMVFVRNNGPVPDACLFMMRGRVIRGQRVPDTTTSK